MTLQRAENDHKEVLWDLHAEVWGGWSNPSLSASSQLKVQYSLLQPHHHSSLLQCLPTNVSTMWTTQLHAPTAKSMTTSLLVKIPIKTHHNNSNDEHSWKDIESWLMPSVLPLEEIVSSCNRKPTIGTSSSLCMISLKSQPLSTPWQCTASFPPGFVDLSWPHKIVASTTPFQWCWSLVTVERGKGSLRSPETVNQL